ncbi:MAG: nitroreductase family deazaflavin-dependent oxidoreductase [Chloroflexota bacterium]|jgi:deazaflavin-dependent oxidoreductase (nitroreductase family)
MAEWDQESYEKQLLEDMRAHDGQVTAGPLAGHPLLVMTSKGAKSGQPRQAILTYSNDNGDYVVAGTAGGSPKNPTWLTNIRNEPEVEIEAGNRTFKARARIVDEAERERLWQQHVARLPHFAEYPKTANRVIPMVRLTPAQSG